MIQWLAPQTFVLFTDHEVKLHFVFERFLGNQRREAFGVKVKASNEKKER